MQPPEENIRKKDVVFDETGHDLTVIRRLAGSIRTNCRTLTLQSRDL